MAPKESWCLARMPLRSPRQCRIWAGPGTCCNQQRHQGDAPARGSQFKGPGGFSFRSLRSPELPCEKSGKTTGEKGLMEKERPRNDLQRELQASLSHCSQTSGHPHQAPGDTRVPSWMLQWSPQWPTTARHQIEQKGPQVSPANPRHHERE